MNAIVLPDLDRSTIEDLKARMPSLHLSDIELPSMERAGREAGRQADRTLDRLMGRSRPSAWPWLAAALGIAAIVGSAVALVSWTRRPGWSSWSNGAGSGLPGGTSDGIAGTDAGIGVESVYGDRPAGESSIVGDTAYTTGIEVTSLEEPLP
ncbi:MAG TPA: hypothetical protein VGI98_01285 [Candidatus Limnocylindrales bacterium]|jgi:hypothetical protein